MGKGGKTTTQTQNQSTSSTALDPVIQQQAYANLGQAKDAAGNYQGVYQQAPAGFNDDQNAGMALARQQAQNDPSGVTLASGIAGAQNVANFNPSMIGAQGYSGATVNPSQGYSAALTGNPALYDSQGYTATQAMGPQGYAAQSGTAAQLDPNSVRNVTGPNSTATLQSYLNAVAPAYQSSVIDPALAAIDKSRVMALQGADAQAAQAGAFGGDRQAIYDAQTNQNYADQSAQTAANLGLQGFNAATGLMQNDQGLGQQAQLANQATGLQAGTTNANLAQQMGLSNLGFTNQAKQYAADQANQFNLANTAAQNQAAQWSAQQANAAAAQNAGAQNTALLSNQAAQNQAGQFGASQGLQTQLANQASLNQAGQFGAQAGNAAALANQQAGIQGAGLNLQGANSLAGLSGQQQQQGFNDAAVLQSQGSLQQQQQQNAQNIAYQNALAAQQVPLTQLGIQQSALGMTPYGTTTTGSGTSNGTQQQSYGLGTQIQQGLGAAAGVAGLFMSDQRLKTNIKPMFKGNSPMDAVRKMKGVSYNWKATGQPDLGLVAQDVQKAAPGAVKEIGGVKHVSAPAVMGLLVEGMKQLDRKVNAQKKGIL